MPLVPYALTAEQELELGAKVGVRVAEPLEGTLDDGTFVDFIKVGSVLLESRRNGCVEGDGFVEAVK
jgi:hypothetical protein